MVGRRDLTIGIASADHPGQYERQTRAAIIHVTSLEVLPTPGLSAGGDGEP
jgi:hypothetical protein